ncbi:hypothetical protein [Streptomyces sp. NPDC050759]|uniref:hypothetical protein n=1 Tax=Streptomyces sp. NPDC050759 TaxID=3365635 RepID=UPI0037B2E89A
MLFGTGTGVGAVKEIPAATSVASSRNSSSASKISVDRDTTTACATRGKARWNVAVRTAEVLTPSTPNSVPGTVTA